MNAAAHFRKAQAIKTSLDNLLAASVHVDEDAPAAVELIYGVVLHLIAYGLEMKYGQHRDTHVGLPKLLRLLNEDRVANLFDDLDRYRAGRWYGSRWNGQVVEDCLRILEEIEG